MHLLIKAIPILFIVFGLLLLTLEGEGVYYSIFIINGIAAVLFGIYFMNKRRKIIDKNKRIIKHDQQVFKKAMNDIKNNFPTFHPVDESELELSLQDQYDYLFNGSEEGGYRVSSKIRELYGVERMDLSQMLKEVEKLDRSKGKKILLMTDPGYDIRRDGFEALLEEFVIKLLEQSYGTEGWSRNGRFPKLLTQEFRENAEQLSYRIGVGVSGEKEVSDYFKKYIKDGVLLENTRIKHNGMSAESDMIYITPSAIYTIEVKNFGKSAKWSIEIGSDGQWRRVRSDGSKKAMNDVGEQINHHVNVLKNFLKTNVPDEFKDELNNIPIMPLIIIANNEVVLDNHSNLKVLRKSSLVRYLEEKREPLVSEVFMQKVGELILNNSHEGIKYPIENVMGKAENMLLRLLCIREIDEKIDYWIDEVYNDKELNIQTSEKEAY